MLLPRVHHAFLQTATPIGCKEVYFLDGQSNAAEARRVDTPGVVPQKGALERARDAIGWVLKNSARLVYISPALVLVKIAIGAFDEGSSNLVIVAFVSIVVLFFLVLNVYIVISVVWWLRRRGAVSFALVGPARPDERGAPALLPFFDKQRAAGFLELENEPLPVGEAVRARGKVTLLGPAREREGDGTVIRDLWAKGGEWRLTEAIDFAVVRPGKVPAVVRLTEAPTLITSPVDARLDAFLSEAGVGTARLFERAELDPGALGAAACAALTLREGDEIELVGAVIERIDNVDGFELVGTYASVPLPAPEFDEAGTPFRDKPGGPGIIVGGQVSILRPARARI